MTFGKKEGLVRKMLWLILALLVIIFVVVFAVQNATLVTVDFLFWEFQSSLALLILVSLAVGIIISLLVSLSARLKGSGG